jgi:hypothetical protein
MLGDASSQAESIKVVQNSWVTSVSARGSVLLSETPRMPGVTRSVSQFHRRRYEGVGRADACRSPPDFFHFHRALVHSTPTQSLGCVSPRRQPLGYRPGSEQGSVYVVLFIRRRRSGLLLPASMQSTDRVSFAPMCLSLRCRTAGPGSTIPGNPKPCRLQGSATTTGLRQLFSTALWFT